MFLVKRKERNSKIRVFEHWNKIHIEQLVVSFRILRKLPEAFLLDRSFI